MRCTRAVVLSLLAGLSACGGAGLSRSSVATGRLDLSQALPAPTLTPYQAYGERQATGRETRQPEARTSIAPYLLARRARIERAPLPARSARRPPASPRTEVAMRAPAPSRSANASPSPATNTSSSSLAEDADRYAQRENPRLESYRGGDVIVITAGTLVIILLVAVIVLLLT